MAFRLYDSLGRYPANKDLPTYFDRRYLQTQDYDTLVIAENENFVVPLTIQGKVATSLGKSPFGSMLTKANCAHEQLSCFISDLADALKIKRVEQIHLKHPAPIYEMFSQVETLVSLGFEIAYQHVNQHIKLNRQWEESIHSMQKRKLNALIEDGFTFCSLDEFETAYQFIDICRKAQGLAVNISWDLLTRLVEALPERYQCFGVRRGSKLSAVCITVNVTSEVVYYYLPATSPLFRSQSPMVLLIAGMVDYYRSKSYRYFDLGVSSKEGIPQETLKLFKARMGGETTKKPFLTLNL